MISGEEGAARGDPAGPRHGQCRGHLGMSLPRGASVSQAAEPLPGARAPTVPSLERMSGVSAPGVSLPVLVLFSVCSFLKSLACSS